MGTKFFWSGFYKRAEAGTGGSGFSGVGKANLPTGYAEQGNLIGTCSYDSSDTKTDKTLLDRQRNPKDFAPARYGQDERAESNPHIIY